MIQNATKALRDEIARVFPKITAIYNNWPGPEVREVYPYIVIFTNRANLMRTQYQLLEKKQDGTIVFASGYWELLMDLNYLAREGELSDQGALTEKIQNFFNVDIPAGKESEVSRDISFMVGDYQAKSTVNLLNFAYDQRGPDLQPGDRRSVFSLSMYVPRIVVQSPRKWSRYEISPEISE